MTTDHIEFQSSSREHAESVLRARCNDGRIWIIGGVFGFIRADAWEKRTRPRVDASATSYTLRHVENSHYWQSGAWHPRLPATAAARRREDERADRAAGVSDGGGALTRRELRRWLKARCTVRKGR